MARDGDGDQARKIQPKKHARCPHSSQVKAKLPSCRPEGTNKPDIRKGPTNNAARKSVSSVVPTRRQAEEEVVSNDCGEQEGVGGNAHGPAATSSSAIPPSLPPQPQKPTIWQDVTEPYTAKYMDMFSPVKLSRDESLKAGASLPIERKAIRKGGEIPLEAVLERRSSVLKTKPRISAASRRSSRLSLLPRRGQSSKRRVPPTGREDQNDAKVLAEIRRAAVSSKPAKGFALYAPYMSRRVMVDGTESVMLSRSNTHTNAVVQPEISNQKTEDIWIDVEGPVIPARTRTHRTSTQTARTSRRNVSFQASLHTEASDDVIVDWEQGHVPYVPPPPDRQNTIVKSRDSESHETGISNDTIVNWTSAKSDPNGFDVLQGYPRSSNADHTSQLQDTQAETSKLSPLAETSHNMRSIAPPRNKSETPRRSTVDSSSRSDIQALLDEVLEAAKATLNEEMRVFQADILKQFHIHKTYVEDALAHESRERQKLVEDNRLLREEMLRERRRKR